MDLERRGRAVSAREPANPQGEEPARRAKPFELSKRLVWEAYKRVKANREAAGVDEQFLKEFERELADNLYQLWNRMASGRYLAPLGKAVAIPKKSGGERVLGVRISSDSDHRFRAKACRERSSGPTIPFE